MPCRATACGRYDQLTNINHLAHLHLQQQVYQQSTVNFCLSTCCCECQCSMTALLVDAANVLCRWCWPTCTVHMLWYDMTFRELLPPVLPVIFFLVYLWWLFLWSSNTFYVRTLKCITCNKSVHNRDVPTCCFLWHEKLFLMDITHCPI